MPRVIAPPWLLSLVACGASLVASPPSNRAITATAQPGNACLNVRSDFAPWMHAVFPQCLPEPFEYFSCRYVAASACDRAG